MAHSSVLHAWMDESMRNGDDELEDGIYILAATVADPGGCDSMRDTLRALKLGNAPKMHWKDENQQRRARIAAAVAQMSIMHTVVVGTPLDHVKQERARRKCMQRLFYELELLGVTQIIGESRPEALNRRDLRMVDHLRSQRLIPRHVRLDFALPSQEPMLWLPDIVAGVVGDETLGVAQYDSVRSAIELHRVMI